MRELDRIGAGGGLRAEDFDHADHRAEQSQQRGHRGDGPQCGQETLQIVRDQVPDLFDRFLHHRSGAFGIGKTRREHAPERTALRGAGEQLGRDTRLLEFGKDLVDHSLRCDDALAKRP